MKHEIDLSRSKSYACTYTSITTLWYSLDVDVGETLSELDEVPIKKQTL